MHSGWWGWLFIPLALPMLIVGFIGSSKNNKYKKDFNDTDYEVKPKADNHSGTNTNLEIDEDAIYEQVMIEIEEEKKIKSTWAKALSKSDGDYKKAESLYINLRVQFIRDKKSSNNSNIEHESASNIHELNESKAREDAFFKTTKVSKKIEQKIENLTTEIFLKYSYMIGIIVLISFTFYLKEFTIGPFSIMVIGYLIAWTNWILKNMNVTETIILYTMSIVVVIACYIHGFDIIQAWYAFLLTILAGGYIFSKPFFQNSEPKEKVKYQEFSTDMPLYLKYNAPKI